LALTSSRAVAALLLTRQPVVQIGDAKAPVFAGVPPWDLATTSLLLERLGMYSEKSRRLDRIQERFEFDHREAALSSNLCGT